MRSGSVVIIEVRNKDPSQMPFIQDDHVVQALASDRADDSFNVRILPRGSGSNHDVLDAHGGNCGPERSAVNTVSVPDQMPRHRVPGKGLPQLLGDPRGRGMSRDPEMHDLAITATVNRKYDSKTHVA